MRDFAWMVRRHEDDILNYFRMPIDNGTVEGLNNNAKVVKARGSAGFRGSVSSTSGKHGLGGGAGSLERTRLWVNSLFKREKTGNFCGIGPY